MIRADGRESRDDLEIDRDVPDCDERVTAGLADAVQQQVHRREPGRVVDQFRARDQEVTQKLTLMGIEILSAFGRERVRGKQEADGATCRVDDAVSRPGWIQSIIAEISARGADELPTTGRLTATCSPTATPYAPGEKRLLRGA
jgi:hypothetical protein